MPISETLRAEALARDQDRCRWCGRTDIPTDLHHIRYRRGSSDDVLENLILLDRECHSFVHGIPRTGSKDTIAKAEAQEILFVLAATPGVTGIALRRQRRADGLASQQLLQPPRPGDFFSG